MTFLDRSNSIVRNLFWVYSESIAKQLVSVIVTIILARLLLPSDFGTLALVTVFIAIADVFISSSFSMALIQKKDTDALDYDSMFWFTAALAILIYAVLFVCAPYLGEYYGNGDLVPVFRVLALRIPLSAYNSVQTAYVAKEMIFRKSFLSTSGGAILSGGIGVAMAYRGAGLWALVAQSLTNVLFNTVFLAAIVPWKPHMQFSAERLKGLVGFGWKLLATGLMFTVYAQLRSLVIGKKYSPSDLGFYDRGNQFPSVIASNIDSSITRVMFPALSAQQGDAAGLLAMTRRAAKTSAYIMTPILFGLAVVAEPFVELLLTAKWLPCVPYIQIMCVVWWMQPTQTCSIQAIKAIGRSDLYLRIELWSKLVGISSLIYAVYAFDTPFAVAVSALLAQCVAVLLYGWYASKYIGYRLQDQFMDLFTPAILAIGMVFVIYNLRFLFCNKMLVIATQIFIGCLIYLLLSMLFRVEAFHYLKNMAMRIRR